MTTENVRAELDKHDQEDAALQQNLLTAQGDLSVAQQSLVSAQSDLTSVQSQLSASTVTVQQLEAQLAAATKPVPAPAPTPAPTRARGVFALFMPNFLWIQDYWTKNFMNPHGENDKWLTSGGFTRDADLYPYGASVDDAAATHTALASKFGIDGFHLCVIASASATATQDEKNHWARCKALMAAAGAHPTFRNIVMLDSTASTSRKDPKEIGRLFNELYVAANNGRGWYQEDNELVVSAFTPENKTPAWWATTISEISKATGRKVRFMAIFQNYSEATMDAFKSVAYAYGKWGDASPKVETDAPDAAKLSHTRGRKWSQSAGRPMDVRHRSNSYAESYHSDLIRADFKRARDDDGGKGADYVLIPTWNDFAEGSHIQPSLNSGNSWGELVDHHISWYKTGAEPTMPDTLLLIHRVQFFATKGTLPGLIPMKSTLGGGAKGGVYGPVDQIGVDVWVPAASTLTIYANGASAYTVPLTPGFNAVRKSLVAGLISASISRGGRQIIAVTGATVKTVVDVQDLVYRAFWKSAA